MTKIQFSISIRTLESIVASERQSETKGPENQSGPASINNVPDEVALRICSALDAASLARLSATNSRHLRLALDPSLSLRRTLLRESLQKASVSDRLSSKKDVHETLAEHLQSVGPAYGLSDISAIATEALHFVNAQDGEFERPASEHFYFALFAPAMREVLRDASPLFAFANRCTQKVNPSPQLSFFHTSSIQDPAVRQKVKQAAADCNLPVAALEASLAVKYAHVEADKLEAPFAAHLDMARRFNSNPAIDSCFDTMDLVAHLSPREKANRIENKTKKNLFLELSKNPLKYIFLLEANGDINNQVEEPGVSKEERIQASLFVYMSALSEKDAKTFSFVGHSPDIRDFVVHLLRETMVMTYRSGAFNRWLNSGVRKIA